MAIVRLPKGAYPPAYVGGPTQVKSPSRIRSEGRELPLLWAHRIVRAGKILYRLFADRDCTFQVGEVSKIGSEVKVLPGLHI